MNYFPHEHEHKTMKIILLLFLEMGRLSAFNNQAIMFVIYMVAVDHVLDIFIIFLDLIFKKIIFNILKY